MKKSHSAFTMVELVFVIVILGILSAIAIPKFAATRDDAEVAKIRSDVATIRSAIISERQSRLIRGESEYITSLDQGVAVNVDNVELFDHNGTVTCRLLTYPIITGLRAGGGPKSGKWLKTANNQYSVNAGGTVVVFTYYPVDTTVDGVFHPEGTFDCDHTVNSCIFLLR
ncbi:MAG: type II secretion system protein [Campylobacterota bacterium]|nr:type II secretion system protein [Campylobacterota bacterium]